MHRLFLTFRYWLPLLLWVNIAGAVHAATPRVVVTIKPIHSLVAAVMQGVEQPPKLLISGSQSPHNFALRPSDIRLLNSADLIFWVGDSMESNLRGAIELVNSKSEVITLLETPGIQRLSSRKGGLWESQRDDNSGHNHSHYADPHIWLSTHNAKKITQLVAQRLSLLDPPHRDLYSQNSATLITKLEQLHASTAERLKPIQNRPYIVFHDAYHAFEQEFELNAVGSITISPERPSGAKRITTLRRHITSNAVVCLFSEPQFQPKLVANLIDGTTTRSGTLDPIGNSLRAGPNHYFQLIDNLSNSLVNCLEAEDE